MIRRTHLTAGAVLLAAAGGFLAGSLMGGRTPLAGRPMARAMSSLSDESFAVCTTPLDMNSEGFFMLDFETGDLTGGVLNQNTAKFTTVYRHNVLTDLGFKPGQVQNPRFLIAPGRISFGGNSGGRMAQSVIYVTDGTTGVTVAYGIPWSPQQTGSGKPVTAELVPLDIARPRGGGPRVP